MINKGEMIFRIYGEPRAFPKKKIGFTKRGRVKVPTIIDDDYRIRTDPATRRKVKYDKGYKKRWAMHVQGVVLEQMRELNLKPFPKSHPVAMGLLFFITKPKSNKMPYPSKIDEDNYEYAIWNALKRTPDQTVGKHKVPGRYPEGILYYDDDQIKWRLSPSGVVWADKYNPPGLIIQIRDIFTMESFIQNQIIDITERAQAYDRDRKISG